MSRIGFQENGPFTHVAVPGEKCFCTMTRSMHGQIITSKKDPSFFEILISIIIVVECKKIGDYYPNDPLTVNGLGTEAVFFQALKSTPCFDKPCICDTGACVASTTQVINSHGGDKKKDMPQWAQDMIAIPPVGNTWGFRHPLIVPLEAAIVKQVQEPANLGFGPYDRDGMPKCSSMKKLSKKCCIPPAGT